MSNTFTTTFSSKNQQCTSIRVKQVSNLSHISALPIYLVIVLRFHYLVSVLRPITIHTNSLSITLLYFDNVTLILRMATILLLLHIAFSRSSCLFISYSQFACNMNYKIMIQAFLLILPIPFVCASSHDHGIMYTVPILPLYWATALNGRILVSIEPTR